MVESPALSDQLVPARIQVSKKKHLVCGSVDEYVKQYNADQDGTWTTGVELYAASYFLQVPIFLHGREGGSGWLIYAPEKLVSMTIDARDDVIVSTENGALYISYSGSATDEHVYNGGHYQPILSIKRQVTKID